MSKEADDIKKQGKVFDLLIAKEKAKAEKAKAEAKAIDKQAKKVSFFSPKWIVIGLGITIIGGGIIYFALSNENN